MPRSPVLTVARFAEQPLVLSFAVVQKCLEEVDQILARPALHHEFVRRFTLVKMRFKVVHQVTDQSESLFYVWLGDVWQRVLVVLEWGMRGVCTDSFVPPDEGFLTVATNRLQLTFRLGRE